MTIDEILNLWNKDAEINRMDITEEALKTPKLHHKYFSILSKERIEYNKLLEYRKKLKLLKTEYYLGLLSEDELQELGWEPFQLRILKGDVDKYIDADKDMIKLNTKIAEQKEKIEILESIIKMIMNRGFLIKSAIDMIKFEHGA